MWTVEKNTATRKNVKVQLNIDASGNDILVYGIESGDTVIVDGVQKVGRGTRVEVHVK